MPISVTLLHNISGGSHGRQQDFDAARVEADADYTALRFAASTTQALPGDWLARAIVNGQYTRDALIAGEQIGAGGASSVRGFHEREVSNDSGLVANLELYSSPLCRNTDWQCRVLAFYDSAYLTRNHALPGEFDSVSINSVGIGMRIQWRKNLSFQVDYGHVLRAEATATQKGDERLHARLGLSF
jgi:hemolysin activation/secretion protein